MAKKFNDITGSKFPGPGLDQDFSRLVTSLNQSDIIQKNPPLYQTILYLIRNTNLAVDKIWKYLKQAIDDINNTTSSSSADYVVLADGAVDTTTSPIGDGAGGFIYTAYN